MASKPTVMMVLAGDEGKLTESFEKTETAAKHMSDTVDDASRDVASAGERFDSLAESTDTAETRFTGFSDTIGGVTEGLAAWNDESLSGTEKMMALGMAGADLAGGLTGFLVPALKGLWLSLTTTVIPAIWSFTAALLANPITWIIIGIIALIAIIVLLVQHWDSVKAVVGNVVGWIVDRWNGLMSWFAGIPAWFGKIFGGIGDAISGAFKGVINWVIDKLNWLINLANKVIGAVNSVNPFGDIPSIPTIPRMHTGGIVPGPPGSERMAILQAGERVTSAASAGGGTTTVTFAGDTNSALAVVIQELFATGQVQVS